MSVDLLRIWLCLLLAAGTGLAGAASAPGSGKKKKNDEMEWGEMDSGQVGKSFTHSLFGNAFVQTDFGGHLRYYKHHKPGIKRRRDSADQAVCPQANESEAMLAAFSGNATQYTEFITGCGGQVAEIEIALGKALTGNADPSTVCANPCISKVMVVLARAGELIPDDDDGPCAQRKAAIAALPKFVGGVLCAKTPRGRPCTRTLQTFFTMSGQLGGANGTDASDAAFFAGASQQWQDQRSLRGGVALAQMCADFQDTGCCFGSVHALVQDHDMRAVSFHVGLHTSIPDAAVDDALRTLQTQCRQQMLPHSNIGASACVP